MFLIEVINWDCRRPCSRALLPLCVVAFLSAFFIAVLMLYVVDTSRYTHITIQCITHQHTISAQYESNWSTLCHCADNSLCQPLSADAATAADGRSHVVAFILPCPRHVWLTFDWRRLTIVVLMNFYNDQLLCHAHAHGVRVLFNANFSRVNVTSASYRTAWVRLQTKLVRQRSLDGVNVDFEQPVAAHGDPARAAFVQLMNETRAALIRQHAAATLMIDVPWSPGCVDGRCYDFEKLATAAHLLFVMGYDQRSQLPADSCVAGANAPLNHILAGLRNYTAPLRPDHDNAEGENVHKHGTPLVAARQLILGLPWYGYDYTCLNNISVQTQQARCDIARRPFRGAACSDAAGRQLPYSKVVRWAQLPATRHRWSNSSQSPFLQLRLNGWKHTHQVWYDNVSSVSFKVMGAASLRLAGIGVWAANYLDPANTSAARQQRADMWGTLPRWNMFDD